MFTALKWGIPWKCAFLTQSMDLPCLVQQLVILRCTGTCGMTAKLQTFWPGNNVLRQRKGFLLNTMPLTARCTWQQDRER